MSAFQIDEPFDCDGLYNQLPTDVETVEQQIVQHYYYLAIAQGEVDKYIAQQMLHHLRYRHIRLGCCTEQDDIEFAIIYDTRFPSLSYPRASPTKSTANKRGAGSKKRQQEKFRARKAAEFQAALDSQLRKKNEDPFPLTDDEKRDLIASAESGAYFYQQREVSSLPNDCEELPVPECDQQLDKCVEIGRDSGESELDSQTCLPESRDCLPKPDSLLKFEDHLQDHQPRCEPPGGPRHRPRFVQTCMTFAEFQALEKAGASAYVAEVREVGVMLAGACQLSIVPELLFSPALYKCFGVSVCQGRDFKLLSPVHIKRRHSMQVSSASRLSRLKPSLELRL